MISFFFFSLLVQVALGLTLLSPVILIFLLIRDKNRGELW